MTHEWCKNMLHIQTFGIDEHFFHLLKSWLEHFPTIPDSPYVHMGIVGLIHVFALVFSS